MGSSLTLLGGAAHLRKRGLSRDDVQALIDAHNRASGVLH